MTKENIPVQPPSNKENESKRTYNLDSTEDLITLFREKENPDDVKPYIAEHIVKLQKQYNLENYHHVLIYDEFLSISSWHSNRIYEAIASCNKSKDIFLFIYSGGGSIEAAYLISKVCKRLTKEKFITAVPRKAKSAATLICLGADEIHMGLLSELGPIDPQVGGYPALGLSNALQKLAKLSAEYPSSSLMFSNYLSQKLKLEDLGYLERITESAVQYAERLLSNKALNNGQTPKLLADHFVNHYKDHGFLIDLDEATNLLGNNIVKRETNEYRFSNDIYKFLDFVKFLFSFRFKKNISFVGSVDPASMYLDDIKEN